MCEIRMGMFRIIKTSTKAGNINRRMYQGNKPGKQGKPQVGQHQQQSKPKEGNNVYSVAGRQESNAGENNNGEIKSAEARWKTEGRSEIK